VVIDEEASSYDGMTLHDKSGYEAAGTEQEFRNYLSVSLSKYKALTCGVRFVDAIPRGASGNIRQRVVRSWSMSFGIATRTGILLLSRKMVS
jgi:acyl-coenzyme A synthetase/AMP-(fatty) acid ligase